MTILGVDMKSILSVMSLVTILTTVCVISLAETGKPQSITLDSGKLHIVFGISEDGRLSVTDISAPKKSNWLTGSPSQDSLWRIAFRHDNGTVADIGSSDLSVSNVRNTNGIAEFAWNVPLSSDTGKVVMTVRYPKDNTLSYWSLSADLPKGWKVVRSDFPLLPNIGLQSRLKMAVPAGWGLEYEMKSGTRYEATYPSAMAGMQFLAFYNNGQGLYIGAHDKRGNHKYFNVTAKDDGIDYLCMNWPAIPAESGGKYKVPFEAAIGLFDGDYYNAAQIYRDFSYSTAWGKGKPVSKRSIPQWMKDTDLWLMSEVTVQENLDQCEQTRRFFNIPISFHWYRWHEIPHDVMYPEYFPTKPDFPEGVKTYQQAGYNVMPYINGRLADANSEFWKNQDGDKFAASQENGDLYAEVYIPGVTLNVMCPYSAGWQNKIVELTGKLKNEIGVNGVYIDQIAAAGPVRCFNPEHGHLPGGGHMWVDGYRKMLTAARSMLTKNDILTTEENAECWIDQLDGQLMANTPTGDQKLIPLFPSVYSGRAITFGFQYMAWDDYSRSIPFRTKMGRAFVWGSQPGWVHLVRIMAPENVKEAEYLRSLARCRRFGHQYLVYGQFLGMLNVNGVDQLTGEATRTYGGGTYKIDTPAVLASAWLAEDGSLGIALTNMSDKAQSAEIRLPVSKAGIRYGDKFIMRTYSTEGLILTTESNQPDLSIRIPERDSFIISIDRK